MEFFAALPPEPPEERPTPPPVPEWVHPPKHEIPVAVPIVRRLARAPGVALNLRRLDVYRTGVTIEVQFDLWREPGVDPERWAMLGELLHPRGHRPGPAGQLRLGVTLGDGTRADAISGSRSVPPMQEPPTPPQLVIFGGRGSGAEDRWTSEVRAWLWPLPPAGPMTLHFVCEGLGITEGALELDTTPILAASLDARGVWED